MRILYATICAAACAGMAALGGCTSAPPRIEVNYVRPDQCLCKVYSIACKYHDAQKQQEPDTLPKKKDTEIAAQK